MSYRPTILLDFDGVLHDYRGWQGPEERFLGPPIAHARHACLLLARDYRLVCFTSRPAEMVERWLGRHGFPKMKVTNIKEPAFLIIDDRALTFPGHWTDVFLALVKSFKPHWLLGAEQPLQDEATDGSNNNSSTDDLPPPAI